jgi:hypothetical protein
MFKVQLKGTTVPHTVKGRSGASTVVLGPGPPGHRRHRRQERPPVHGTVGHHRHPDQGLRLHQPQEPRQGHHRSPPSAPEPRAGRRCAWRAVGKGRRAS